ncbi:MAG: TRAP transporter substrate-binding protein [Deltaproteobacteria bacterium]|nr:MAG: TRAP transporter substrate-binding protein [Deltaproteobacteria bacterium]
MSFKKKAEERTKGRLKIEVYPNGSLFKDKEIHIARSQGMVEMGINGLAWMAESLPLSLALASGVIYSSREQFWRCADGDLGKMWAKELETKLNTKLLSFMSHGPSRVLVCTKKLIREPGDLKGLRWRAPGIAFEQYFLSLGVSPVRMSVSDVYIAMERGTIDGVASSDRAYRSFKWHEVARYLTDFTVDSDNAVAVAINLATWNKLPGDIQKILLELAEELSEWSKTESYRLSDENWKVIRQLPNIEIYVMPPEKAKDWYDRTFPDQMLMIEKKLGKERTGQLAKILEKYR